MKLIIAIVPDTDSDAVSHGLTSAGLKVTYIASTGGFLRRGHSTLLIGLEDEKVSGALQTIRENCAPAADSGEKRGVIFVLNVAQFIHF
jgi:uncharacterized protein YaaQ